jgi:flagellar biosynthesis/type III secretory pathway chaperone
MPTTTPLVSDLVETLDQQNARIDALRHLLAQERQALRRNSPTELTAVTATKLGLLDELRELEARRMDLVARLAESWQREPGTLSLSEIAAQLEPPLAGRLLRRRESLRQGVEIALEAQAVARAAVTYALEFCDEVMRTVRQAGSSAMLYLDSGEMATAVETVPRLNRQG